MSLDFFLFRFCGPKKGLIVLVVRWIPERLCPLASNTAGQLDVLGHDGHSLGVDCTEVGILEEANQVGLGGFLQRHDCRGLESQVSLEVLGNFSNEPLERKFPDEELGALLVSPDLPESYCTRPVPMGLLDTSCGRG